MSLEHNFVSLTGLKCVYLVVKMTPNVEFQDADILRYGYYYYNNFERKTNFLQKCQLVLNCPFLYYLIHNVISIITVCLDRGDCL